MNPFSPRAHPMHFRNALLPFCFAGSALFVGGYADRPEAKAFIQDMVERHHFEAAELRDLLEHVQPQEGARQWVRPPAEPIRKNWQAYRSHFVEPVRIGAGLAFWREHRRALARARREYGIPEEIIVGILGVETIYGRRNGSYPVLDTLATLGFDYPETPNRPTRSALFLQELEAYLVWCRDTHQDPHQWQGSYTGAMGLPQFLPTSIQKWALDFDGDGRTDLQGSPEDAIGSVANYLKAHGWKRGSPIDLPVGGGRSSLKAAARCADGEPEPRRSLAELRRAGIRIPGRIRPARTPVLVVDLPSPGRPTSYRIGFQNFYVLTRYNRSFFYAAAVTDLGRAVKARLEPPRRVKMKHRQRKP